MAKVRGANIQNMTTRTIVIGKRDLRWFAYGSPGDIVFVDDDVLNTPEVKKLLNQLQPNGDKKVKMITDDQVDERMKEIALEGVERSSTGVLVTPRDHAFLVCAGENSDGSSCQIMTNDPTVLRPFYCTQHEDQRLSIKELAEKPRAKAQKLTREQQAPGTPVKTVKESEFVNETLDKLTTNK